MARWYSDEELRGVFTDIESGDSDLDPGSDEDGSGG
jgi:hypothetical protein